MEPCKSIEANGGTISKERNENFLTLTNSYNATNGYHVDLIHNSIANCKLQDLLEYKLPGYKAKVAGRKEQVVAKVDESEQKPTEVGDMKHIVRKSMQRVPLVYDDIFDVYSPYSPRCLEENELKSTKENIYKNIDKKNKNISNKVTGERYTLEEDIAIMKYIIDFGSEHGKIDSEGKMLWGVHGNIIWENMEKRAITVHTWKSMKDRYFKFIRKIYHKNDENITLDNEGNVVLQNGENITLQNGENILQIGKNVALPNGENITLQNDENITLQNDENITLQNEGNVDLQNDDNVTLQNSESNSRQSGKILQNSKNVTLQSGDNVTLQKIENITSQNEGNINVQNDEKVALQNSENVTFQKFENITLQNKGNIYLQKGKNVSLQSGGNVTMRNGENILQNEENINLLNLTLKNGENIASQNDENVTVQNGENILENSKNMTLQSGENITFQNHENILQNGENVTFQNDENITLKNDENITLQNNENITLQSEVGYSLQHKEHASQNEDLLQNIESNTSNSVANIKQSDVHYQFQNDGDVHDIFQNNKDIILSDSYTPQRTIEESYDSMDIVFSSQNSLVYTDKPTSCNCRKKEDYSKALSIVRYIDNIPEDNTCWKAISERLMISDIAFKYGISIECAMQILEKYV